MRELKAELKRRRHLPIPEQGRWLASVARGHLAYYAVPGKVCEEIVRLSSETEIMYVAGQQALDFGVTGGYVRSLVA